METPLIRAKAKDSVDALDNLIAYLDEDTKNELVEFVLGTLGDLEKIIEDARNKGEDPLAACKAFVARFITYWNAPPD